MCKDFKIIFYCTFLTLTFLSTQFSLILFQICTSNLHVKINYWSNIIKILCTNFYFHSQRSRFRVVRQSPVLAGRQAEDHKPRLHERLGGRKGRRPGTRDPGRRGGRLDIPQFVLERLRDPKNRGCQPERLQPQGSHLAGTPGTQVPGFGSRKRVGL